MSDIRDDFLTAAGIAERVDAAVSWLATEFETVKNPPVRICLSGEWSRMLELTVHSDDLVVSVGVGTPRFPENVVETVVDLLSRLAVRRHGATNVIRALSRAERAPASITAF